MDVKRALRARPNLARGLVLLLGVVTLDGCSGVPAASSAPAATTPPAAEIAMANVPRLATSAGAAQRAALAANAFAFDLFAALPGQDANTVFSPSSIAIALAMARAGAKGDTAVEMDRVMHDLAADANADGLASLDASMSSISGPWRDPGGTEHQVTVRIANAAFGQRDTSFVQQYLDALAARFAAGVRLVDYRADAEGARNAINAWVDGQTEHRIKELLAQGVITPLTRLTLVNAIYLKAPWETAFSAEMTKDAPFTRLDGSKVDVPTMHQSTDARYAAGSGWKAVELGYGGGRLAMTIVVPEDLAAFERTLDQAAFGRIVAALENRQVRVALPKFKTETKVELADVLAGMGMKLAFTDRADFSGITTEEALLIDAVIHQANIDVDEKGTEAAAATAVVMRATGIPAEPAVVDVDRPFLYAIRDLQTGAILFMGRVVDPSKQ